MDLMGVLGMAKDAVGSSYGKVLKFIAELNKDEYASDCAGADGSGGLGGTIGGIVSGAGNGLGNTVGNAVGGVVSGAVGAAGNAIGGMAGNAITNIGSSIGGAVGGAVSGAISGVAGSIGGAIGSALGSVGGKLGGAIGGAIGGALGSVFGGGGGSRNVITGEAYIKAACKQAKAIKREATIDAILMVLYSLFDLYVSNSITNLQEEIAHRQLVLAEELHAHTKEFWPYEDKFIDDAFDMPKPCPQYGLAKAWSNTLEKDMENALTAFLYEADKNHITVTQCDVGAWDAEVGKYKSDISNYALRQAEARADALDDVRYNWRLVAVKLGRGLLGDTIGYNAAWSAVAVNPAMIMQGGLALVAAGIRHMADTTVTPRWQMPTQVYAPMPQRS